MESLGAPELLFAAVVLVVAYAVRSSAGFGGQVVAVPLLALVLPLPVMVSAVVVLTVLASFPHWARDWRHIDWREIARLLPYTLIGIFAGLYLLQEVDIRVLTRAFGAFVLLYACFALATAARPVRIPPRGLALARVVLSALAGFAGAAFGAAAGPLYAMYFGSMRIKKDAFRITITTILTIQAFLRITGYARLGFYDQEVFLLIAAGVPLVLLGSWLGTWMAGRLDEYRFNLGVAVLLLASGTALLLK
jgi:uncharacterized membrane protein YfcA